MKTLLKSTGLLLVMCTMAIAGRAQTIELSSRSVDALNVKVEEATYKGKKAVRVKAMDADESVAILKDKSFENGTIEIKVAGTRLPDADPDARAFIGLAFRFRHTDSIRYECFYIRPTNGRAEDQLRRNHSTQYISHPKYTWYKLRNENPGLYESYTDMAEGEWTQLKIEVKDNKARLYVNGASQPCLIVNDLKYAKSTGSIALWVGPGTDGYFTDLKITK
jgi:hypothetical protein